MNQPKPIFQNTERAAFEFGRLLRALPEHLHGATLNAAQVESVEAADQHAANSRAMLLDGLQSLGRVLWSAGVNERFPPDVGDCARVGSLVTEIALQIEFLNEFRDEVAEHNAQKGVSK
jgi:hypothetical protein